MKHFKTNQITNDFGQFVFDDFETARQFAYENFPNFGIAYPHHGREKITLEIENTIQVVEVFCCFYDSGSDFYAYYFI